MRIDPGQELFLRRKSRGDRILRFFVSGCCFPSLRRWEDDLTELPFTERPDTLHLQVTGLISGPLPVFPTRGICTRYRDLQVPDYFGKVVRTWNISPYRGKTYKSRKLEKNKYTTLGKKDLSPYFTSGFLCK